MKLTGRPLEIASGAAGISRRKVVEYRSRWKREGYELPDIDWDAVPVSDGQTYVSRSGKPTEPPKGPGSELRQWLSETFGFPSCGFCRDLAKDMDEWGVEECRNRLDEIADRIIENTHTWIAEATKEGATPSRFQKLLVKSPDAVKRPAIRLGVSRAINATEQRLIRLGESVAVVIPCHNYARYLGECIDSVLAQTAKPREVVVVDDSSTDGPQVPDDVTLIRINAGHVLDARKAGFDATTAPYVCFLDADDTIGRDYLEAAIEILDDDWKTAIAYSDTFHFGESDDWSNQPSKLNREGIDRVNRIHAGAVVRRSAVEIAGGFDIHRGAQAYADWHVWRKILDHGWDARKSRMSVYNYRKHGEAMMDRSQPTWFEAQGLESETVSLLIPLSGRSWGPVADFLRDQTWPHSQLELVLGDTSQDAVFSDCVRNWMRRCDYPDVRHVQFKAGERGLADKDRRGNKGVQREVNRAMSRIWRRLTRGLTSRYTWTLEDDVTPPDDVLDRMLRSMERGVDAVCAPYRSRYEDHYIVRELRRGNKSPQRRRKGVKRIESCGFGCMVCRSAFLRDHVWDDPENRWYDPWFFTSNDMVVMCDWDIEVAHGSVTKPSLEESAVPV
jgi:GT2 family glycosyltransferase